MGTAIAAYISSSKYVSTPVRIYESTKLTNIMPDNLSAQQILSKLIN